MNQTTANAAALALVGALALQLAACGTAQQSAPGQASTQPEPVTLTMSWWGDDARTETYQQAIQAFEAKLQYITVETIYGTTADEDQTADVMQVDWTWPGQNADQFVDLNEYSDVIDLEQFSQSALDACTVDGALLAVPMSVTGRIFYWNTCTFEQAGIDAPKTYEELLTAGNTFREVLGEEYYPPGHGCSRPHEPDGQLSGIYHWQSVGGGSPAAIFGRRDQNRAGIFAGAGRKPCHAHPCRPADKRDAGPDPPCGRTASTPVPLPGMPTPKPTAVR
ncbi:MAG: ABC transporter substrate-binding protein [Subdoligranulum sp.]